MKRKFSSIGRVAMVLVLALTLGLVMAVPVSATHTSSAIVDFAAPPVSTIAGEASILDVTVTNAAGSAGKITTVKIDFTASDFAVTGAGTLPGSWTATGPIAKVVTYTYATGIAKGASVIFSPAVTNPTEAGPAAVPAVKTTDAGSKAAVTAAQNTGWIGYVADSAGVGGNAITVEYINPFLENSPLSVSVAVKAITVSLATDAVGVVKSTASEVAAAITASAAAGALVDATADAGHLTYVVLPLTVPAFTGGISPDVDKVCSVTPATLIVTPLLVPVVSTVSPARGNVGDTMWVEVTGNYFTGTIATNACTTDLDFGADIAVESYKFISATEIDVLITIEATGTPEVVAHTAAGQGTVGATFTANAEGIAQVDVWDKYTPTGAIFGTNTLVFDSNVGNPFTTIQAAVTAASEGDIVRAHAATYNEQVVIGNSLTLIGAGDTTIIRPSGADILTTVKTTPWIGSTTKQMAAIVFVDTATTVTVMDLKIDGSLITEVPAGAVGDNWVSGLAYLETSGTVGNLTVIGNPALACRTAGIWASAVAETTGVSVTGCSVIGYNRAGIYAVGGTLTADYNNNEIYGPGELIDQVPNGIYFLVNAKGSATYNFITDLAYTGEQYLSTGIGVYEAGADITFGHNEVSDVQMAFCLAHNSSGTIVENNDIHDCQTGVKIEDGAASHTIQYNDIYDNDFAIRCDDEMGAGNVARFNNFVNNSGAEWTNVGESRTYVGAVCNLHETSKLDAKYNFWGEIGGPGGEGLGLGDTVSADVLYDPWLTRDQATAIEDGIAYHGDTYPLEAGWNTLSVPLALDDGADTLSDIVALGDFIISNPADPKQNYLGGYYYDAVSGLWVELPGAYEFAPCKAVYVKMAEDASFPVLYSGVFGLPSLSLPEGWNLIGSAFGIDKTTEGDDYGIAAFNDADGDGAKLVLHALASLGANASVVISPSMPGQTAAWATTKSGTEKKMIVGEGYWVFLTAPATLAGFEVTPIYWIAE